MKSNIISANLSPKTKVWLKPGCVMALQAVLGKLKDLINMQLPQRLSIINRFEANACNILLKALYKCITGQTELNPRKKLFLARDTTAEIASRASIMQRHIFCSQSTFNKDYQKSYVGKQCTNKS